jgi:uncharacterized protein (TIGR01319 family)
MYESMRVILATDCGSTTSKARFFKKIGEEYRYIASGEAPTTVEAPYEDVTMGVRNAVREVEELTGHKLLGPEGIISPSNETNEGVDIYVTTSSAGGGLQMSVIGLIKSMTAESAERAALGAGAIVMDIVAYDDGRDDYEKIQSMRFLRPDMILFAGGTDGGDVSHISELAQFLKSADPKPRFGASYELPVVYAANARARKTISGILGDSFTCTYVDNVRPTMEIENTEPARNAIHELFMEHVMAHAPGYDKLMKWTPIPIMPTPAGEGMMFRTYAEMSNENLIGVGLGGATTNIYSIYDGKFVRSVSANLGMSYSICNVLNQTGIENILRWIPFDVSEEEVLNRLRNKMIRPTTIPQTLKHLMIEHAVAREALRMGFIHHKSIARPLLGARRADTGSSTDKWMLDFTQTYIDMMNVNYVGGTGGLLSHAPERAQSALILSDGFEVEGITSLFQDSVFMMPHLGVLSTVNRQASMEVFEKDCLVKLGTSIAFRGQSNDMREKVADITITLPTDNIITKELIYGTIMKLPLGLNEAAQLEVSPTRKFDIGAGNGRRLTTKVTGGVVGIILDARGRPFSFPEDVRERQKILTGWFEALDVYPDWRGD